MSLLEMSRIAELAEARNALTGIADRFLGRAKTEVQRAGKTISCYGCHSGDCCLQAVSTTFLSAVPIALQLQLDGRDTPALRDDLARASDEQADLLDTGLTGSSRCPFLTDSNRCSVYDLRPLACMTYWAISPRDKCGWRESYPDVVSVNNSEIVGAEAMMAIDFASQFVGDPVRAWIRPLADLVLRAFEVSDTFRGDDFWKHYLPGASISISRLDEILAAMDKHGTVPEKRDIADV